MLLGSGEIILLADDEYRPESACDGCLESAGSFSSLLAMSANDHIRGLLFRLGFVLPPGVCFTSVGGR